MTKKAEGKARKDGALQALTLDMTKAVSEDTILAPEFELLAVHEHPGRIVVVISDDKLGTIEDGHGEDLMLTFLRGLLDRATLPDEVVFYHRGVLLLEKEHPAESVISHLCTLDIEMKSCLESLEFYKKEPAAYKIQPVPMSEITRDLLKADRVIHP
jgi:hypothetical protein